MTAITYRKPILPLEILVRTTGGISLQMPIDVARGQRDRAPEDGRKVRKLVRALVAYKQAKRK
jgi:hypothetical protein